MSVAPQQRGSAGALAALKIGERLRAVAPIYIALVLVIIVSWILVAANGGDFMTVNNITSMLRRSVALGIVAAGQTLVILAASLDLSVAYLISVAAVLASTIMNGDPNKIFIGVAAVIGVGIGVGLANGLIITKLRVNAFIATLGTALIMQGILQSQFQNFAGEVPREFETLGYGEIGPIPLSVILFVLVVAAIWFLLKRTRFGHRLYAVGGSEETARLSGVRTHRVIIIAHVLCSVTAVITGLFIASRLRAGAPWVGPDGGYDLESIAAVVVGGTALSGGKGGVLGTIGGVFILAVLDNVFNQLGVNAFLKDVLRGVIIIGAVAIYATRARRRRRA